MRFRDERVQYLWDVSDIRTLAVIAARWPDLVPEWWKIAAWHDQAMTADGMRTLNPTPADQYVGREWAEFEAYRTMRRWQIVRSRILEHLVSHPAPSVLDIGCHTGGCGIDLANALPSVRVVLREVQPHIAAFIPATIALSAVDSSRLTYECGDHAEPPLPARTFDAIWAGEILEHQWEWRAFVNALHAAARPGALIAYSVPLGPWEPRDRERGEHVAQWDIPDVINVFGDQRGLGGVQLQDPEGPLGNFCFWYETDGEPLTTAYPIEAKLARLGFGQPRGGRA